MLRIQTQRYIEGLSDAELIEYLGEGVYEADAIAFAQAEFTRRNLNPERVQRLTTAAEERIESRQREDAAVASTPLGRAGRVLAFISGYLLIVSVIVLLTVIYFDSRGYQRKKRDLWAFIASGFVTSISTAVIFGFLFRTLWLEILLWPLSCLIGIIWILNSKSVESEMRPASLADVLDPTAQCRDNRN